MLISQCGTWIEKKSRRRKLIVSYQWQKKTRGRWRDIPGATGPTLAITNGAPVRCRMKRWDKNGSSAIHGKARRG